MDSAPVLGGGPPECGGWTRGEERGGSERRFVAEREIVDVVVMVVEEEATAVGDSVTIIDVVTDEEELEELEGVGDDSSARDASDWVLVGVASDGGVGVGTSEDGASSEASGGAMSVL